MRREPPGTTVTIAPPGPARPPLLASLLLLLTVLQGTSFTLTLAVRSPLAGDLPVIVVTLLWMLMYLAAAVALVATSGLNWLTWLVRYRLALILLVAGATFSSAWSVDTALTLERSIHLMGTTLLAIYLGFALPLNRIVRSTAITLGLLMIASALAAWFMPTLGLEPYEGKLVWAGVMASKNTLGFWAAVSLLMLVSLIFWPLSRTRRLFLLCLIPAALACLYHSVSATSVLALISGALVMLYLLIGRNLQLGLLSMAVLGLLLLALLVMAFSTIDTAEMIGRSGDLTGRSEVWRQTWDLILQRPLTGYGYGTLWYPTDESVGIQQALTDFSWTVYHAHNGLLQIASEIGLPLTALALLMILQQLLELLYCQYQRPYPGVLITLGFIMMLLVSNYSEARLLVNRELYWILFIMLPISMLQQASATAPQRKNWQAIMPRGLEAHDKLARSLQKARLKRQRRRRLHRRRPPTLINADPSRASTIAEIPDAGQVLDSQRTGADGAGHGEQEPSVEPQVGTPPVRHRNGRS